MNGLLAGFRKLFGVGGYMLLVVLHVEGMMVFLQPWISLPFQITQPLQIGLTVLLGGLCLAGLIWFNASLNLIKVNLLDGDRTLVTHGPFGYVRHPLYAFLLLTGLPLTIVWAADGLFFLAWIVIVMVAHVLVLREERGLREEFGDAYKAYRQYVPALLPYMGNGGKRYRAHWAGRVGAE